MSKSLAALGLVTMLLMGIGSVDAEAAQVSVMGAKLPTRSQEMSAVWDSRDRPEAGCPGGCAYLFGGFASEGRAVYDRVLRYNPERDNLTILDARLPSARYATSAVWTGERAYVFGGVAGGSFEELDEILVFDPVVGSLTLAQAKLPAPVARTSAVWHETTAYLFGGTSGGTRFVNDNSDKIISYDPGGEKVAVLTATLVPGRAGTSAVLVGDVAYIFGGVADPGASNEIVRFTTQDGRATPISTPIIPGRGFASAALAAGRAYIFGGSSNYMNPSNQILSFDPASASLAVLPETLPGPAHASAAISNGAAAFIFGGWTGTDRDTDTIVRFLPDLAGRSNASQPSPSKEAGNASLPADPSAGRSSRAPGPWFVEVVLAAVGAVLWPRRKSPPSHGRQP